MLHEFSLQKLIGSGYKDFWNCKKRFRVVKGSRGSKKSVTTAFNNVIRLMNEPESNLLVVRRYKNTLKDSCYAQLQWVIDQLHAEAFWKCTVSPLEMTYIPTGQKILFRGLDEGLKVTSITVKHGVLNYVWIEEAYELENKETFEKLEMSVRGKMPKGMFKQFTLTFNPWSETTWLKKRFFDTPDEDVFTKTTTYKCNEFLDESDIREFEKMKVNSPRRYRIEGEGEWGISEGLIYSNVECRQLNFKDYVDNRDYIAFYGLDFGYTDPTAFVGGFVNLEKKEICIFQEIYISGITNQDIAERIKELGIKKEVIKCDSAEPKSIEELRKAGLNARAAVKGPDSVKFGIQKLQNFKIIYDPACENFGHEISNYCWEKDRNGNITDRPDHEFSHLMDALRYAISDVKPPPTIHPNNIAALHRPRRR